MSQKPSIPKGTRDFGPLETQRRNYIFDTIKAVFAKFGYQQIETPALENLSTLLGKYGEEGDKLLFKILNSGDYLSKASESKLEAKDSNSLALEISEKGLRYDLTVPFARYVVMHQNEINFPFKRFQIQPVWRADRPQRGRYREFYQCDADVIGSKSLMNEVELVQIIDSVFTTLGINVLIKINNRKILAGMAETIGHPDKLVDITIAIDKVDKIGIENVYKEMIDKGIPQADVEKLEPFLTMKTTGSALELLADLEQKLSNSKIGLLGIDELRSVFEMLQSLEIKNKAVVDLTLARGLNYYTGAIFEVAATDVKMGSISGGGRYDDLTGIFGLNDVSGVGISFGADRIYDVLEELNAFPENSEKGTKALFVNFGKKEAIHCLSLAAKLRESGIYTEIYPDDAKLKKQMTYADKNRIEYVIMVGENEISQGKYSLKNMVTGEQQNLDIEEIIERLTK